MVDSYLLYTQKLEGEYKEVFGKIDMYVCADSIEESAKEDMMSNLLDVFLTAQEEGRPVKKIIGTDIEKFCKEFCSGHSLKAVLMVFLESVRWWVFLLFVISALDVAIFVMDYLEGAEVSLFSYKTEFNIALYGLFLLAVFFTRSILDFIVKKVLFKCNKGMRVLLQAMRFGVVIILVVLFLIFENKIEATMFPTWISFILSGALLIIERIATKESRRQKQQNKISFWEYCKTTDNKERFQEVEDKQFAKVNEKRMRKGYAPLTREEYLKKELMKIKKWNEPYYYIVIPIILVALCVTWMYFTNQFESWVDMGVYVVILFIVEALAMRAGWKFQKGAFEERRILMEQELEALNSGEI